MFRLRFLLALQLAIGLLAAGWVPTCAWWLRAREEARWTANRTSAQESLKAIEVAQWSYQVKNMTFAPSLRALTRAGLLKGELADGIDSGYSFFMVSRDHTWSVQGSPLGRASAGEVRAEWPEQTGDRHFQGGMAGLIFFNTPAPVWSGSASDPVLGN